MTFAKDRDNRSVIPCVILLILVAPILGETSSPRANATTAETAILGGMMAEHAVLTKLNSIGGYFIENRGQVTEDIRYYSIGNPAVAFRDDGVMFVLREKPTEVDITELHESSERLEGVHSDSSTVKYFAYLVHFDGGNVVTPVGRERLPFNSNFFIGNDPRRWRTNVPSFQEVVYNGLYDGIDLIYRAFGSAVKYEFRIEPGVSPGMIGIAYQGISELLADGNDIAVRTSLGILRDSAPYSYQSSTSQVRCDFVLKGHLAHGFECKGQNLSEPLVIDPLIYSTFLGGGGYDSARSIVVDSAGNTYAAGETSSFDFPATPGAFDIAIGGTSDSYVTKLDSSGTGLLFSTFMGGTGRDSIESIALDSADNVYMAGVTSSLDFPVTPGAFDSLYNGGREDAFIAKLDAAGNSLHYSTFIGGSQVDGFDMARSLVIDGGGNAYVTGATMSPDFPTTPGAFSGSLNGGIGPNCDDAFVVKMDATGSSLLYSTFLGGGTCDSGNSIAVDPDGNAYIVGHTDASDFPATPGAFDTQYDGWTGDGFVAKLNTSGSSLIYATFLGGGGGGEPRDEAWSVAADLSGNAYVAGITRSPDFPTTPDAFDRTCGTDGECNFDSSMWWSYADIFVTKLNSMGSGLVYSTFLGGSSEDFGPSLVLDSEGNAYIDGITRSSDFPASRWAFDRVFNGTAGFIGDAFVARLNAMGSVLTYSTFLGGRGDDCAAAIALDDVRNVFVGGVTNSTDFPATPGIFDSVFNGVHDAFVTKLNLTSPDLSVQRTDIVFAPPSLVAPGSTLFINATVHNIGGSNASNAVVRFHDGSPSGSNQIGTDQTILMIRNLGGTGLASIMWSAGAPGLHNICVFADPDNNITEIDEDNNIACNRIWVATSSSVSLPQGLRLMSFPLVPVNGSLENVLSSVSGCYDYVRWYDALDSVDPWKSYTLGRSFNDLNWLDNTKGFWINFTSGCTLTIVGVMEAFTVLSLYQGWNMVGFPSFNTSYTVADLKANLGLVGIVVEAFDPAAAPYYLQRATDSYVMMAGEGYWIYVPSDTVWIMQG